jgi:hypothetical protein
MYCDSGACGRTGSSSVITATAIRIRQFLNTRDNINYLCFPFSYQFHFKTMWTEPCSGVLYFSSPIRKEIVFLLLAILDLVKMRKNYNKTK